MGLFEKSLVGFLVHFHRADVEGRLTLEVFLAGTILEFVDEDEFVNLSFEFCFLESEEFLGLFMKFFLKFQIFRSGDKF